MSFLQRSKIIRISLEQIERNPYQPRKEFKDEEIVELAESIRNNGLIQKITVIAKVDTQLNVVEGRYVLISGERRLRAYQYLHETTAEFQYNAIEAVVDTFEIVNPDTYKARLMLNALAENINRTDLTLLEKAQSIREIKSQTGKTYREIGEALGKSVKTIDSYMYFYNALTEEQRAMAIRKGFGRVELERLVKKNRHQQSPTRRGTQEKSLSKPKKALQIHFHNPKLQRTPNRDLKKLVETNQQRLSDDNVARVDQFIREQLQLEDPSLRFFLVKKYVEDMLNLSAQ